MVPRMKITTLLALMCCALPLTAAGQSLDPFTMQGRLTNAGGSVPNGDYSLTIHVYATADAKTPLYTELLPAVPIASGALGIRLGSNAPVDASMFHSVSVGLSAKWMGLVVGSEPEPPGLP